MAERFAIFGSYRGIMCMMGDYVSERQHYSVNRSFGCLLLLGEEMTPCLGLRY